MHRPAGDPAGGTPREAGTGNADVTALMLSQFPAAAWTLDTELTVTSWAGSALLGLGLNAGDFVGRHIGDFYEAFATERPPFAEYEAVLRGQTCDVEVGIAGRAFQAHLSPLRDEAGGVAGIIGVALDVTERAAEADQLRREVSFRTALTRFFGDSLRYRSEGDFYDRLLATAIDVVPEAQAGSVWLKGDDDLFRATAAVGFELEAFDGLDLEEAQLARSGSDRGFIGRELAQLERTDQELSRRIAAAGPVLDILTTLGTRVVVDGDVVAYLVLHSLEDEEAFDDAAKAVMSVLANEVGALLHHARLEHSLKVENAQRLRLLEDYRSLAAFGAEIEKIHDTDELIAVGMTRLLEALQFDTAMFTELRGSSLHFTRLAGADTERLRAVLQEPQPLGAGINGRVALDGEPRFVRDYLEWPDRHVPYSFTGVRSMLALPVRRGGQVRHTLAFATLGRLAEVDSDALHIATGFVHRLENAFERLQHLEEIAATREATFRSLGVALEYRDLETKGHTDRVVDLAGRFAAELGLNEERSRALAWGAYLHDLGKVAVPDTILLKPARLTAEEFEVIKRHALHGHAMIADIPFLPEETRQVVRSHHERWDGAGYPDGLAGDGIPLLARMFSLIDVYDALTSERPYKPAWTPEKALEELERQAGRQFDPDLVTVFLSFMR